MQTRQEQLRAAKRRQRSKDRKAGKGLYQVKLPIAFCDRLKAGMSDPDFVRRFCAFLQHEIIRVDDYPNLSLICWNRELEYMTREHAFKLYERNWRLVDDASLLDDERALIRQLTDEFGRGVINA